MKQSTFLYLALTVILAWHPVTASGHETETCLMRVAQAAEQLKACQITKTAEDECDSIQQKLHLFRQQCSEAKHIEEHIERAARYGAELVAGDPSSSPYEKRVARERWEKAQTAPNIQRFSQLFPQYEHFNASLMEHFATQQCPTAYHGKPDRWLYMGSAVLQRYGLGEGEQQPPQAHTRYFFAPETANQCYPIPPAGQGEDKIVHVPEMFLQELAREGSLVKCQSASCTPEKEALVRHYQQYQGAYRQYRQLMQCVDVERRNQSWGAVKGILGATIQTPDYCPEKEVEVAYLNAKGLAEELDARLFQDTQGALDIAKVPPD